MESKTIRHTASMLMTATIILLCIPEAAGLFVFGFGIAGLPYLVLVALIFFGTWALADHQGRALIQLRNAEHASGRNVDRTRDVAFRAVAEAFDARVVQIRKEQDAKAADLELRRQREQEAFIRVASPILTSLMREAGARVILERREVLLGDPAMDITAVAIERLNQTLSVSPVDPSNPEDE